MFYNFDEKIGNVYPTRMALPDWFGTLSIDTFNRIKKLVIVAAVDEINVVGDYNENDLLNSEVYNEPATLDYDAVLSWANQNIPIEEPDVLEWMVEATALNAYMWARAREYARAGSLFVAASGDPYIPGVRIEDLYFTKETGNAVATKGYCVIVTPQGKFNCSVPGKRTITTKNILAWAYSLRAYIKQWLGGILKFKDIAINPSSRIGFVNMGGLVAPLFIGHQPSRRAFRNIVEMSITTDKAQTVTVTGRAPTDYSVSYFSFKANLREGQNVIKYKIRGLFGVPPMVIEIQPQDQTKTALDYYKVYP